MGIVHGDTIDLEPMEIKVKSPDGRTVTLIVNPFDTVDNIKEQVNKRLSIPVEDQRPTFKGNALPNKSTLRDNNIVHGDTIDLEPMKIKVKAPDGRTVTLPAKPVDTVDNIKEQVNKRLSIPVDDQRPTFKG